MAGKVRPSQIIMFDNHAEIIITDKQGNEKHRTLIDLEDVDKVKKYRWCSGYKNYVKTTICINDKWKALGLHRFLLNVEKGRDVDHINRNVLDNRKSNLRIANRCINRYNSKLNENNKSGYSGVVKRPNGKWESSILVDNKKIYLAETYDKELAIQRRIVAEEKYFPGAIFNG